VNEPKRVMLLIETSRAYGRGCLLGVAAYVRSHGRWSIVHIERGLT
jgi:LacI family transcriptional regulator, galactose operon repressor